MVTHAELKSQDTVLEIGSGFGFLTELLAEKADKVIAIEVDSKLAEILEKKFAGIKKIKTYCGDFLKLSLEEGYNKVISNPPYSIASKILFKLLDQKLELAILLFQADFAKRLGARVGTKEYGRLSVMCRVKAQVELMGAVSNSAFYPKPRVSSMMVRITPRKQKPFEVADWNLFEQTVRFMFTQRNKKVKNALETFEKMGAYDRLVKPYLGIPFLERRVFTLTPEEFGKLSDAVYEKVVTGKA
jgi:16S rRNA (adenine1518-N6/adenine1519-N6)-dimethyltransferase